MVVGKQLYSEPAPIEYSACTQARRISRQSLANILSKMNYFNSSSTLSVSQTFVSPLFESPLHWYFQHMCCWTRMSLCDTGWRRCTGCHKVQVSFCKRATNYRALIWQMTGKEKASYASSPPCRRLQLYLQSIDYRLRSYLYMQSRPPCTRLQSIDCMRLQLYS